MSSNSRRGPLPLSLGCSSEQVQHGHVCPFLNILHSTLPLAASVLVSFQCFLQDSFREGVMACYVSKPNQLSSPYCCQEGFLWAHNKVQDLSVCVLVMVIYSCVCQYCGGCVQKFDQACQFFFSFPASPSISSAKHSW